MFHDHLNMCCRNSHCKKNNASYLSLVGFRLTECRQVIPVGTFRPSCRFGWQIECLLGSFGCQLNVKSHVFFTVLIKWYLNSFFSKQYIRIILILNRLTTKPWTLILVLCIYSSIRFQASDWKLCKRKLIDAQLIFWLIECRLRRDFLNRWIKHTPHFIYRIQRHHVQHVLHWRHQRRGPVQLRGQRGERGHGLLQGLLCGGPQLRLRQDRCPHSLPPLLGKKNFCLSLSLYHTHKNTHTHTHTHKRRYLNTHTHTLRNTKTTHFHRRGWF